MPSARPHRRRRPAPAPDSIPVPGRQEGRRPATRSQLARTSVPPVILALGVAAIAALVLGRVVGQDFVLWDDTVEIYRNGYFNPPSWEHLGYLWTHPYLSQYVPLTDTAWALLANLARLDASNPALTASGALLDPHVFHIASLLLHFGSVVLAYLVLQRLTGAPWPSAAGALLFGIHPLQVESVAWASELRGILAGFFSLIAILFYVRQAQAWNRVDLGIAFLATLLAMLSKPSATSLPLVLLVLDRFAVGRTWTEAGRSVAAFAALSIPFLIVAPTAQPVTGGFLAPPWQRPFVAGDALAFYLLKLVFPIGLAIDYGRSPALVMSNWFGFVTWLVPAGLAAAAFRLRGRLPWLLPSLLVPVAVLAPVLGFIPFAFQYYSTAADRYMYLALLGPALALAHALRAVGPGWGRLSTRISVAATGGILALLAVLTFVQAGYWADSQALMTHAIAVNSRSDVAYNNLGIALGQQGRLAEAKADLLKSIGLNGRQYQAHSNLGNVLFLEKKPDEAIAEYRVSIAINPNWDESHANLGNALSSEGKWQEAVDEYRTAVRLNPQADRNQAGLNRALLGLQTGR